MSLLVRTCDVPVAQRREAWRSVVCDTLGPLDIRSSPEVPLEGEIYGGRLGRITVGHIRTSTPHSVHRTPGLIRGDDRELFRLVLPLQGSVVVSQGGKQVRLGGGDFAIYDFARPYELGYQSAVRLAVFGFPRHSLAVSSNAVGDVLVRPLGDSVGTGALIAPLLHRVALDMDTYRPASAVRLDGVVMDLLTALVGEHLDVATVVDGRDAALLARIHVFIDQHLGDADLDPRAVAAAEHISLRHLHRLFGSQQTTVASWIRNSRLERCYRDLADPAKVNIPISAVARRWGLSDPAHFSRLFRHAYGISAAEHRRGAALASRQRLGAHRQPTGTKTQARSTGP